MGRPDEPSVVLGEGMNVLDDAGCGACTNSRRPTMTVVILVSPLRS